MNDVPWEAGRGLGLQERYTFDTLVSGPSNEFPVAVAHRVAAWADGHFNPVVFHGPYGSGKTHLLNALAWEALRTGDGKRVLHLSADRLTSALVQALRDKKITAFAEDLRKTDLLLIDDAHVVAAERQTREALFHILTSLVEDGPRLVLTANLSPNELSDMEPRLRAHLQAGLVCGIEPADRTLRLGILERKLHALAAEGGFHPAAHPAVLQFLAERFTDNVRELEGALNTLVARAGGDIARMSLDEAQAILRPHLSVNERKVTVDMVQKTVAEHYALKQADLISERRARAVARPRQVAMWLASQLTKRSLPDIGRRFGGRDYTTVLHAVRRIEALLEEDPRIKADVQRLTAQLVGDPPPAHEAEADAAARAVRTLKAVDAGQLPKQSDTAPMFDASSAGPIRLAPEAPPHADPEKVEVYEELLDKTRELIAACARRPNRTALLASSLAAFRAALGESLADVRPRKLWARGNRLRLLRDADGRARETGDPEDPALPEMIGALLEDLVQQWNVLVMHDSVLMKMDTLSLGPRDRAEVLQELKLGRELLKAVQDNPGIMDEGASAALGDAVATGSEAVQQTGVNAEQAAAQSLEVQKNGAIAILLRAVREVKSRLKTVEEGALKEAGVQAVKRLTFAHFVNAYETVLLPLLHRLPGADVARTFLKALRDLL